MLHQCFQFSNVELGHQIDDPIQPFLQDGFMHEIVSFFIPRLCQFTGPYFNDNRTRNLTALLPVAFWPLSPIIAKMRR